MTKQRKSRFVESCTTRYLLNFDRFIHRIIFEKYCICSSPRMFIWGGHISIHGIYIPNRIFRTGMFFIWMALDLSFVPIAILSEKKSLGLRKDRRQRLPENYISHTKQLTEADVEDTAQKKWNTHMIGIKFRCTNTTTFSLWNWKRNIYKAYPTCVWLAFA